MSSDTTFIKRNRPVTKLSAQSKTRPADTTTYAAGDVLAESTSAATVWTFGGLARAPGLGGTIQRAVLIDSAAPALKIDAELWLFDTAPTTQNDNEAWNPSDAELEALVARVDFPTADFKVAGANGAIQTSSLAIPFQCTANVDALYGILVVRNAFVPASNEKFTIRLHVLQN